MMSADVGSCPCEPEGRRELLRLCVRVVHESTDIASSVPMSPTDAAARWMETAGNRARRRLPSVIKRFAQSILPALVAAVTVHCGGGNGASKDAGARDGHAAHNITKIPGRDGSGPSWDGGDRWG
jgi:hypothetical protein